MNYNENVVCLKEINFDTPNSYWKDKIMWYCISKYRTINNLKFKLCGWIFIFNASWFTDNVSTLWDSLVELFRT